MVNCPFKNGLEQMTTPPQRHGNNCYIATIFLDYTCYSEKYNFQHKLNILGSEIDLVVIIGFVQYNAII